MYYSDGTIPTKWVNPVNREFLSCQWPRFPSLPRRSLLWCQNWDGDREAIGMHCQTFKEADVVEAQNRAFPFGGSNIVVLVTILKWVYPIGAMRMVYAFHGSDPGSLLCIAVCYIGVRIGMAAVRQLESTAGCLRLMWSKPHYHSQVGLPYWHHM